MPEELLSKPLLIVAVRLGESPATAPAAKPVNMLPVAQVEAMAAAATAVMSNDRSIDASRHGNETSLAVLR